MHGLEINEAEPLLTARHDIGEGVLVELQKRCVINVASDKHFIVDLAILRFGRKYRLVRATSGEYELNIGISGEKRRQDSE